MGKLYESKIGKLAMETFDNCVFVVRYTGPNASALGKDGACMKSNKGLLRFARNDRENLSSYNLM